MTVLLVAFGAAIGAPLRYLADRAISSRLDGAFPWGTLCVNVAGSFVLGALTGLSLSGGALAFAGTGFCGALTTYSTFGYETLNLLRSKARGLAVLNVLGTVAAGLAAAAAGYALFALF